MQISVARTDTGFEPSHHLQTGKPSSHPATPDFFKSNIPLDLCHAGPAYEHQKHSVQLFEFDMPTIDVPEAGIGIDRIEGLLGYYEQVKQLSTW
jgi:hypothetical protein